MDYDKSKIRKRDTLTEDPSFVHLQSELARIDVLIRRQVWRWQQAGQDPADEFRGLYVSDEMADALLARPLGSHWGAPFVAGEEETARFGPALASREQRARQARQAASQPGRPSRWAHLAETLGLEPFDQDALLICLAPSLDLRYQQVYGYLQDDVTRKRPSVSLVLDLLCEPGPERLARLSRFRPNAPLVRGRLIEIGEPGVPPPFPGQPLLGQPLLVDESVLFWLLGSYAPGRRLDGTVRFSDPAPDPDLLSEAGGSQTLLEIESLQSRLAPSHPVLVFYGPDQAAQKAAVNALAHKHGRPLLVFSCQAAAGGDEKLGALVAQSARDALLTGAVLYLEGWDELLKDGSPPAELLETIVRLPAPVIIAGRLPWHAAGIERTRRLAWFEFPAPGFEQRRSLWGHFLGLSPTGRPGTLGEESALQESALKESVVDEIADRFALNAGQIRDAAAAALDQASQQGRSLEQADLFSAARRQSRAHLAGLAQKLPPRYGWADIVLPEEQIAILNDIAATVRARRRVMVAWGLERKLASSQGVTVLFSGPPGTGKTMAAEILAGELGLDLYRIDLSTIVSKYIGETEKNLSQVFAAAESANVVLFFDEADALFGKRSEVRDSHDRYANIEISYLLQRMEAYQGITILATNLRANLDEAFTRRLQFVVDFPFPEVSDRKRIWQALFPPQLPRAADLDFDLLARRYKLAGGSIRNALVSAAYQAVDDGGLVTMQHLLYGVRRELQKMGRMLDEA